MIARTQGCALRGLTGVPIAVEAYAANGLPHFTIVGLTDRAIQEARERVRAAIGNSGFKFPQKRLTVNLAPAELPKEGTGLDLPMALAVLGVSDHAMDAEGVAAIGELGLDGALRPVTGALAMARSLRCAGVANLIVPVANSAETALVEGLRVLPAPNLSACVAHLEGTRLLQPLTHQPVAQEPWDADALARIRGQVVAKRALEIAAAGGHNLLLMGPPGVGKTMLAHALAGLLPPLDNEAALEVAALYSLKGALGDRSPMSTRPPFRAPHHSVSRAGLIGGGAGLAQPGEISLAHRGVLLLDEFLEFPHVLLEALRQPLEERSVVVARARGAIRFPADFTLIAAANPCRCGYLGDDRVRCTCTVRDLHRYRARLSGPLRDRLDLVVHVARPRFTELFDGADDAREALAVAVRIQCARARQGERVPAGEPATVNARLLPSALSRVVGLDAPARRLLEQAGERLHLSPRAHHRVLRVARTIADLAGDEHVGELGVAEALRYRGETA